MPVERITHPRIGHSRKVTALTDLEFRVWDTYRWCADDFGVLPRSSAKLQGENEALERHPREAIDRAVDRCIDLELLVTFEHQKQSYLCSLTWQTHQRIRYPRGTFLPCPPPEVLERMDVETLSLFRTFHGNFPKQFRKMSQNLAPPARGRARNARANANANASGKEGCGEETPDAAVMLVVDHYRERFHATTGANPDVTPRDVAALAPLVTQHTADGVRRALDAMFAHADDYTTGTGFPLTLFHKQFNRYAALAATAERRRFRCEHTPPCADYGEHSQRRRTEQAAHKGARV